MTVDDSRSIFVLKFTTSYLCLLKSDYFFLKLYLLSALIKVTPRETPFFTMREWEMYFPSLPVFASG